MYIRTILFLSACCFLNACVELDNQNTNPNHHTYNRQAICRDLQGKLQNYNDPRYRLNHPIDDAELKKLLNKYNANGCDK